MDDTWLEARGMKQLPQGIAERDQHIALLLDQNDIYESCFHIEVCGSVGEFLVQRVRLRTNLIPVTIDIAKRVLAC